MTKKQLLQSEGYLSRVQHAGRLQRYDLEWEGKRLLIVIKTDVSLEQVTETGLEKRSWLIGLASFFFILLQSVCAAVTALSGLRLLIGIASLAAASSTLKLLIAFHADAIRIPMVVLAILGSAINLYVIWRIRSLRARPSSSWRVEPVTPEKKRAESIQIALAILTLLLVVVEMALHLRYHGTV
jgi:uncharacterized membrane protein